MTIIYFFFGLLLMFVGFLYLYRPDKISAMNTWLRDNLFSDRLLLTHRRKAGMLLIAMGVVLLFLLFR